MIIVNLVAVLRLTTTQRYALKEQCVLPEIPFLNGKDEKQLLFCKRCKSFRVSKHKKIILWQCKTWAKVKSRMFTKSLWY